MYVRTSDSDMCLKVLLDAGSIQANSKANTYVMIIICSVAVKLIQIVGGTYS